MYLVLDATTTINHQFLGFVVASLHVILLCFIKRTSYLHEK